MNILLTCAGRRNYMVRFFKTALGKRGQVLACDASASAPALFEADRKFIVPPIDHAEYFDALLSICREQQVRLLVSVNELELGGLAQHANCFREAGTIPVVSAPHVIATCQDKWATYDFLRAADIPTPHTYLSMDDAQQALTRGIIRFPLLIKPRWGNSSIGIEFVESERELALAHEWGRLQLRRTILARISQTDPDHCFIIQEWLQGDEFGMDVVNDLNGNHVATLGRRKLAMRNGNTDRAITVTEARLDRLGRAIGHRLAHVGSLDCDVIVTEKECQVLDLNPRLGGGYPFSHLAGANLPAALIAWANREEPDPSWFRARCGVVASKYDGIAVVGRPGQSAEACPEEQELKQPV